MELTEECILPTNRGVFVNTRSGVEVDSIPECTCNIRVAGGINRNSISMIAVSAMVSPWRSRVVEEAVPVMKKSVDLAEKTGIERSVAIASYNYACTCARAGRFDESLSALKKAIALDPKYREDATTDPDFQEAVKRDEFKKLLK